MFGIRGSGNRIGGVRVQGGGFEGVGFEGSGGGLSVYSARLHPTRRGVHSLRTCTAWVEGFRLWVLRLGFRMQGVGCRV